MKATILSSVLATLIVTVPVSCFRVAIIGAGVGGASTAYNLRHEKGIEVDV